jgi:hypothetical protein
LLYESWVRAKLKINGSQYNLYDLALSSNGGYVKFSKPLGKVLGVGDRYVGHLDNIRYFEDATGSVKESSFDIYVDASKNADEAVSVLKSGTQGIESLANQIDNTLSRLRSKAKFELLNTCEYKIVAGHHPMAKKAFEGDLVYDYKKAFSVATSELDKISGIDKVHAFITGQQNSLYTAWKKANANTKITIDIMADIEIQAMKNVGIPEDIAIGWVVKALEDLKAQGVTEIKNIPWNGAN